MRSRRRRRPSPVEGPGQREFAVGFDHRLGLRKERPVVVVADSNARVRLGQILEIVETSRPPGRSPSRAPGRRGCTSRDPEEEVEDGCSPSVAAPGRDDRGIEAKVAASRPASSRASAKEGASSAIHSSPNRGRGGSGRPIQEREEDHGEGQGDRHGGPRWTNPSTDMQRLASIDRKYSCRLDLESIRGASRGHRRPPTRIEAVARDRLRERHRTGAERDVLGEGWDACAGRRDPHFRSPASTAAAGSDCSRRSRRWRRSDSWSTTSGCSSRSTPISGRGSSAGPFRQRRAEAAMASGLLSGSTVAGHGATEPEAGVGRLLDAIDRRVTGTTGCPMG